MCHEGLVENTSTAINQLFVEAEKDQLHEVELELLHCLLNLAANMAGDAEIAGIWLKLQFHRTLLSLSGRYCN